MAEVKTLYDEDFLAWSLQQADQVIGNWFPPEPGEPPRGAE